MKMKTRCGWAGSDPLYIAYHDQEWGVPVHDDPTFFEFLVLESAQAGLSWITVLKKREAYREAFGGFDVEKVARYGKNELERLLKDPGIVKNQRKIESAIENASAFLKVQEEFGSFDAYIWRFVGGEPRQNTWRTLHEVPAHTPDSRNMSRDMKERGFAFVGPTICYAFMQAVGLVNDHVTDCFRHEEVSKLK